MQVPFPPRPKDKINPVHLPAYEQQGRWVVQRKFNGQHVVVHIAADKKVSIYGRMQKLPENFTPSQNLLQQIANLNLEPELEYWLDGELLDAKTKNPAYKNKIIFFDILQHGKYLFPAGPTFQERMGMVDKICGKPSRLESNAGIALVVTPDVWMAETWDENFVARYQELLTLDEIEGLILKDKTSRIDSRGLGYYETSWLIRCRKPHPGGNYAR